MIIIALSMQTAWLHADEGKDLNKLKLQVFELLDQTCAQRQPNEAMTYLIKMKGILSETNVAVAPPGLSMNNHNLPFRNIGERETCAALAGYYNGLWGKNPIQAWEDEISPKYHPDHQDLADCKYYFDYGYSIGSNKVPQDKKYPKEVYWENKGRFDAYWQGFYCGYDAKYKYGVKIEDRDYFNRVEYNDFDMIFDWNHAHTEQEYRRANWNTGFEEAFKEVSPEQWGYHFGFVSGFETNEMMAWGGYQDDTYNKRRDWVLRASASQGLKPS